MENFKFKLEFAKENKVKLNQLVELEMMQLKLFLVEDWIY